MESKAEIFKDATALLEDHGHDASFRDDYSGRGMYGKTCPAITTDAGGPLVGALVYAAALDRGVHPDDALDFVPGSSDSMGLSVIYY